MISTKCTISAKLGTAW